MSDLPLADGFFATPHRFLWHEATRTVVLSDLHLGAEVTLARQGMYLPDVSTAAIRAAWGRVVERRPRRVVIAGDLFDAEAPGAAEVGAFEGMLKALAGVCEVVLLPGNHDRSADALAALFGEAGVRVESATAVGGYAVVHGHRWEDADAVWRGLSGGPRGIVVGHQHPAVVVRSRVQAAKMICYAAATVRLAGERVPLVILPAFSPLPLGSNLLTERNWILDLPRPEDGDVRILGLVEPKRGEAQVLDFGLLSELPG